MGRQIAAKALNSADGLADPVLRRACRLRHHVYRLVGGAAAVAQQTDGNYFYFPEHDNMMHWELLHGFNDSLHCFDLEKTPFMIFKKYYETLDTKSFHAGWLIVNNAYTTRSDEFLHRINVLNQMTFLLLHWR